MAAEYTLTLGAVVIIDPVEKELHVQHMALYSTGSMEIDVGARTNEELVILFANGNDGKIYGSVSEDTFVI